MFGWADSEVQDTVTGFLLAGVGHRNAEGQNFLVVKPGNLVALCYCHVTLTDALTYAETEMGIVEEFFKKVTNRSDVAIVLINQHVANMIRHAIRDYNKVIPTVLEIPSKDQPYDPSQDYIMQRVNMVLGAQG